MQDPIFEQEQAHLEKTYAKLEAIERESAKELNRILAQASKDKSEMGDDAALDLAHDDMAMETYADLEAMNRIIDGYSLSSDVNAERLRKTRLLLQQPYFAKVRLQFKPGEEPRDIYLGAAGMTDEKYRHFIVDWRSPVAETYYNQENGDTSYEAHGRTIKCNLQLRRQFDIYRDQLRHYFDTTVAIEDPLLLASLSRNRSSHLSAITATIQKEQNRVVRHEDVPVLLVEGIAGSGKTSVLLQRIAYLFYRQRETLRPDQVYLISPNPVFGLYISDVLPDMGETNPKTLTWTTMMESLGLSSRAACQDPEAPTLRAIDAAMPSILLEDDDFRDLCVGEERVITAGQVRAAVRKFPKVAAGARLAGLVEEELHERLEQRIKRLSKSEEVHDEVAALELDEHIRLFGHLAQPENDEEACALAQRYLQDRYEPVSQAIERAEWLRIDRIGLRLLQSENLSAEEWLYLKMALTGYGNRDARFVMVDEVQDYTVAQLAVMARYFKNAHFLLLGDENQAIREGTATFSQMEEVFAKFRGEVSTCRLLTSYRSSPEITALFCKLLPPDAQVQATSVQRPGTEPRICSFDDDEAYLQAIGETVSGFARQGGLTAVIVQNAWQAKRLAQRLADCNLPIVGPHDALPAAGAFAIPLKLAKGLEFDRVVIPDADAETFRDDTVSRHRLYTSVSRATKEVAIFARGPLTPLLR